MTLLMIGGTADARRSVAALYEPLQAQGIDIIYSLAGLVRVPELPCRVHVGGFSQCGGLEQFIVDNTVAAILDMSHPYAANISDKARVAATRKKIPYWRFERPAWRAKTDDKWFEFRDWPTLIAALQGKQRVLLTAGQMAEPQLQALFEFSKQNDQQQWLRTAVTPKVSLPSSMHWHKAIGPFKLADELALLQSLNIDVVVSKNSGGESTSAKLAAARQLKIPVYMLQRPDTVATENTFNDWQDCLNAVLKQLAK